MSKFPIPSLLDMSILNNCTLVVHAVQDFVHKETKTSRLLGISNRVVSGKICDGKSITYSTQNSRTLISKGGLDSSRFPNWVEHEFSKWIAKYGILLLLIVSKYLQQLDEEAVYKTAALLLKHFPEVLKSLIPMSPLHDPITSKLFCKDFPKNVNFFSAKQNILDQLYRQLLSETKLFANSTEHFCKPSKMPVVLDSFYPQMPSRTKIFAKDLERFEKRPDIKTILNGFNSKMPYETKMFANNSENFCKRQKTPATLDLFFNRMPAQTNVIASDFGRFPKPPPEIPTNSKACYAPIPSPTKLLAILKKDLVPSRKSLKEIPTSQPSIQQKGPDTKKIEDNYKNLLNKKEFTMADAKSCQHSKNLQREEICSLCKELVSKKKFFGERRFVLLDKCDCVICYGCIRKETRTSHGMIKGPVWCPLCAVKSEIVASSARCFEGKEKVKFLEIYRKNVLFVNMKIKMGWTSFPTRKDNFSARGQKMMLAR